MNLDIAVTLLVLGVAVLLLTTQWIRPEATAILVLAALAASGQVTTEEALSGFSSSAVISIVALLIISSGLVRSGAVHWVAARLQRLVKGGQRRLLLVAMLPPALLSGVVNIVAAVSIFIPAILHLARKNERAPSRLLLPMALASLAGANLTLIGAGHNLVVDSMMRESGAEGISFFAPAPIGACLIVLIALYSLLFAHRLLPQHALSDDPSSADSLVATYQLRERLWELWVRSDSPVVGKTLRAIGIGRRYGLSIISLVRGDHRQAVRSGGLKLEGEDVLLVGGSREQAEHLCRDETGLLLTGPPKEQMEFPSSNAEMIEVVVPPRSNAIGKTLRELRLRNRTGLTAVALWRNGRPLRTGARDTALQEGDGLLLFGARERTRNFDPAPDFLWLQAPPADVPPPEFRRHAPMAVGVLFLVVMVAALGWLSIAVTALTGAAAMVLLRILTPKQAYAAVDWRTIALIAGMYPLGKALENSGTIDLLSGFLTSNIGGLGPRAALVGVGLLAVALTQPMHSSVVAVILTPLALGVSNALGVNPMPFAMTVMVGASASYLMPVGHPAPLLVQQPGEYSAADYFRFGIGPVLLVLAVMTLLIPLIWPL